MKNTNTVAWVIGAILLVAIVGWVITRVGSDGSVSGDQNATSTPVQNATSTGNSPVGGGNTNTSTGTSPNLGEMYANATHGFTISYPRTLNAQSSFNIFHQLNQNDWRYAATAAKRGTPVVSIPVIEINNEASGVNKNYPLFYTAQVRVGVSTDTANCYAKDDGYANQTVTDVTIGGVPFKKFIFGNAAMMKYVNGASYRTIRNNKCYVIEQIENGSSYRDAAMVGGYTDADLKAFYNQTTPIVMSFRFK